MTNIEKLSIAGLIASDAKLSSDEIGALEAMSPLEVATLIGAHTQVRQQAEEPRVPTFHVSI